MALYAVNEPPETAPARQRLDYWTLMALSLASSAMGVTQRYYESAVEAYKEEWGWKRHVCGTEHPGSVPWRCEIAKGHPGPHHANIGGSPLIEWSDTDETT